MVNQTLLAELGSLCQKAGVEAIEALKSPRLQREVKRVYVRAMMQSMSSQQNEWSVWARAVMQWTSSPEWSKAAALLCGLYLAKKLVSIVAQGRASRLNQTGLSIGTGEFKVIAYGYQLEAYR